MIAVMKAGGKQYVVREGDKIKMDKVAGDVGATVTFEVLLAGDAEGKSVQVGTPTVKGMQVEAKVVEQGRGPKIGIQKYKNKTRYRRYNTHRQMFTKVEIVKIGK